MVGILLNSRCVAMVNPGDLILLIYNFDVPGPYGDFGVPLRKYVVLGEGPPNADFFLA